MQNLTSSHAAINMIVCRMTENDHITSALLVSDIWWGPKIKKIRAADLTSRRLADKFLYRALVLVNDYQCAKFQRASSINYGDMQGVPK